MPILNPPSVQIITSDLERRQLQVSAPSLPSGGVALLGLQMGISMIYEVECINLLRLRLYGSEAARAADLNRAIAVPPRRGVGLLLEVVSTASFKAFELAPVAWNQSASGVFAAVTNLESQPASPVFSIDFWEF